MIIFNYNSQSNSVFVNFDEYDEIDKLYNIIISSFVFIEFDRIISKSFFINFYISPQTNSLSFEIINLNKFHFIKNVHVIETFFEKKFNSNK